MPLHSLWSVFPETGGSLHVVCEYLTTDRNVESKKWRILKHLLQREGNVLAWVPGQIMEVLNFCRKHTRKGRNIHQREVQFTSVRLCVHMRWTCARRVEAHVDVGAYGRMGAN